MNKSDLNSCMLFKFRDGRLCALLNDENNELFFYDINCISTGVDAVMALDDINDELMLTENNITSHDIIAIKQFSSSVAVISHVLEDEEPEEWDWVREEERKKDKSDHNKNISINITLNIDPNVDIDKVMYQLDNKLKSYGF